MCLHDAQVVRDEQVGQPELGLQIQQQIQDLRLHRDVQRRDRLVGDHQARVERQRAGDADALALPPLKACGNRRMYSGRSPTRRSSSATRSSRSRRLLHAVHQQRLADEVEQRHARD